MSARSARFPPSGKDAVIPPPEAALAIGDQAPDFCLASTSGPVVHLYDVLDHSSAVLFFYVKAFTPVCMAEVCSFRDNAEVFSHANARLFGISPDGESLAKRFAAYHKLPFPLLIDDENRVRFLYRVRKILGLLPGRSTFVVGQDRRIVHITDAALQSASHITESLRSLQDRSPA